MDIWLVLSHVPKAENERKIMKNKNQLTQEIWERSSWPVQAGQFLLAVSGRLIFINCVKVNICL